MDIDIGFIRSVLQSNNYMLLLDAGIHDSMFENALVKRGIRYIGDYYRKYNKFPTSEILRVEGRVSFDDCEESIEPLLFYADKIKERHLFNAQRSILEKCRLQLEEGNILQSWQELKDGIARVESLGLTGCRPIKLAEAVDIVKADYQKAKRGEMGYETPWPSFNENYGGFIPKEFSLFVARPGVGKTMVLLVLAHSLSKMGINILFVSPEMTLARLALRDAAIRFNIPYNDFRLGHLSEFDEQRVMNDLLEQVRLIDNVDIITAEKVTGKQRNKITIENITSILGNGMVKKNGKVEPYHIVLLDGIYMISSDLPEFARMQKNDKMDYIISTLCGVLKERDMPGVGSTQFNREIDKDDKKSMNTDKIGLSDSIGQYCNNIFGLWQDDDMYKDKVMDIVALKGRDSGRFWELRIMWNFLKMKFDEIQSSDDKKSNNVVGY